MISAVTLVHKGAMPIAVHAVATFARHFKGVCRLRIHSDGSLDDNDEERLLVAAGRMEAVIVRPTDRAPILEEKTAAYPLTNRLLSRGGYFTKLQLPVCEEPPYFYFDSDIVWLRPVMNLVPHDAPNAFSAESWSWYYGVADDSAWIRDRVPRRVNSGFYYLSEPFPSARMEGMLEKCHFDPSLPDNTDQEIMAYLYRNMEYYHPEDLKRSRRGIIYDLASEPAAALHFPGGMWRDHLEQFPGLMTSSEKPASLTLRYLSPVPVSRLEFLRMRLFMWICTLRCIQEPLNLMRKARNLFR